MTKSEGSERMTKSRTFGELNGRQGHFVNISLKMKRHFAQYFFMILVLKGEKESDKKLIC